MQEYGKIKVKKINSFNLNNYIPHLYSLGYYFKDLQNLKAIVLKKPLVRVNLTPISDNLFGVNYARLC